MIKTYIDSGVLIAAYRGVGDLAVRAVQILDSSDREFASSQFVKLEILPKATHGKRQAEVDFYQEFFAGVTYWSESGETVVEIALQQASVVGLGALDALHVASAISVGADELVTTEQPTKPIHRVKDIQVISIHGEAIAK